MGSAVGQMGFPSSGLNFLYQNLQYNRTVPNQKIAILRLIPKGIKDRKFIRNKRPVSLLNSSYKVYAKVLRSRIEKVIPSIIANTQNAYIKKGSIFHNLRNISDVIDYCNKFNNISFLLFVDFEKAFDTIN